MPIAAEYSDRELRQQYVRCYTCSQFVSRRSATMHVVHTLYGSAGTILKYKSNVRPDMSLKIQGIFFCVIGEIPADVSKDHSGFFFQDRAAFHGVPDRGI